MRLLPQRVRADAGDGGGAVTWCVANIFIGVFIGVMLSLGLVWWLTQPENWEVEDDD